jgi:hypothetical protein
LMQSKPKIPEKFCAMKQRLAERSSSRRTLPSKVLLNLNHCS